MQVQMWPIDQVRPYQRNPRKNDRAADRLAGLIREYGFRQPILVDGDGVIIAGHTRLKAAKRLGLEQVPVIVVDDLPPERVRALRIADNASHEWSEWDIEILQVEVGELVDVDVPSELIGFSANEVEALLADLTIIDTSGQSDDRTGRTAPGKANQVVSIGRLSGIVDYQLVEDACVGIRRRYGEDPAEALRQLCEELAGGHPGR